MQFSSVLLKSARSSLKRRFLDGSLYCSKTCRYLSALIVAFHQYSYMTKLYTTFVHGTDSDFLKCSWPHEMVSMPVYKVGRSQMSTTDVQPCPLRTEISPDCLNLLFVLCILDDEIFSVFRISHLQEIILIFTDEDWWNSASLRCSFFICTQVD